MTFDIVNFYFDLLNYVTKNPLVKLHTFGLISHFNVQPDQRTSLAYLSEWSIFIYCWSILQKMGWFENKHNLLISML